MGLWSTALACLGAAILAGVMVVLWPRYPHAAPWVLGLGLSGLFGLEAVESGSPVAVAAGAIAILVVFFVGQGQRIAAPLVATVALSLVPVLVLAVESGPAPSWATELPRAASMVPAMLVPALGFMWIRERGLAEARRAHHRAAEANQASDRLFSAMGLEVTAAAREVVSATRVMASRSGTARREGADLAHQLETLIAELVELRKQPHRHERVDLHEVCETVAAGRVPVSSSRGPVWLTTDPVVLARLFGHLEQDLAGDGRALRSTSMQACSDASGAPGVVVVCVGAGPTGAGPEADLRRTQAAQLVAILGGTMDRRQQDDRVQLTVRLPDLGAPRTGDSYRWRPAALEQTARAFATMAALSIVPFLVVGLTADAALAAAVGALAAMEVVLLRRAAPRTAGKLGALGALVVFTLAAVLIPSPVFLAHIAVVSSSLVLLGGRKALVPSLLVTSAAVAVAVLGLATGASSAGTSMAAEVARASFAIPGLLIIAWSHDRFRQRALALARRHMLAANVSARRRQALVTTIGHELRTRLNALLGLAQAESAGPPGPGRDAAATLERSCLDVLVMVNLALDLAEGHATAPAYHPAPVQLSALLDDVVAQANHAMPDAPVTMERLAPAWASTDGVRLREALGLLVRRARLQGGGQVTVCAAVAPTAAGVRLDVTVHHPRAVDAARGGVDLAVARELARHLGATITVKADRVSLTARLAPASPGPVPSGAGPARPGASALRVLLVDDTALNLTVARRLLEKLGVDVATASSGTAALEVVASGQRFDLVLMDLQMPDLDGCATSRELRSRRFTAPIIGLTASAHGGTAAECVASGMQACIEKPVRLEQLRSMLSQHARGADA